MQVHYLLINRDGHSKLQLRWNVCVKCNSTLFPVISKINLKMIKVKLKNGKV